MKWAHDPLYEAMCKMHNWFFEIVKNYAVSDVDKKASEQQQSRVGRVVDQKIALEYGMLMEAPGATFLMPTLNVIKGLPVSIINGLHRFEAMEVVGITHFDTYVMHMTNALDLDLFMRLINTRGSRKPVSDEEMLANIAYMIEHHRMPMKDAAKEFGMTYKAVNVHMLQNKNIQKAAALGVNTNGIARSIFTKISPLIDNDKVYSAALQLIAKSNLSGSEADQFITQVRKGTTESSRLAVVDKWDATYNKRKIRKKAAIRTPVRDTVTMLMSRLRLCLESNPTATQLQIQPEDVHDFLGDWAACDKVMTKVIAEVKSGKPEGRNGKR